ncbi:MAG: glycosyltransferase family 4 protein [FCB group bacterium]|nr:glycosyltransferase family 4 protein [FCB group bacterium]
MKKILILTHEFPPFYGGVATYASELALAADALGHQVTVVAPDFGEDCQLSDRQNYPFSVIRYHAGVYSFKKLIPLLLRAWRYAKADRYDIIHAVDWPYAMALAFINKIKKIPFVATVYGTEILGINDIKQFKFLLVKNPFGKAQKIFAISEFTKALLWEKCPDISPDKVITTLLGINVQKLKQIGKTENVRDIYSIPPNNKIILTVSRLDERKGHRTVLNALAQLPDTVKQNITYVIIGGSGTASYKRELEELKKKCGVQVIFTGKVSERRLKSFYHTGSIFCMPGEPHPQKVEGFGLVYLEAAVWGLPAIASKIGGVPEVVLDGKTGLLVEPLDISALTKAIIKLLTDEPYRKKLGENVKKYAQTFTWQKCAQLTYGNE